jgi:molecular chaperone DnaK (HSP70)
MRLGIDFGTTRTRVAAVLGGNYPLVTFHGEDDRGGDWYPSLIAARGNTLAFGWSAQRVEFDPDWAVLRSFKRRLGEVAPEDAWTLGGVRLSAVEWLTRFFAALRQDLLVRSSLEIPAGERLEALVGIPANANSNQRFLTLEAARLAGFEVIGMLNEPSAAGIEYAHRYRRVDMSRRREHVVVYDLGGGTFDVAVVSMAGNQHEVVGGEGIARLGGDDLDAELLGMIEADPRYAGLKSLPRPRLAALCREAKESITPNSRKVTVDLGVLDPALGQATVSVPDFFAACTPLIERTIESTELAMQKALGAGEGDVPGLAAIYLVGGSSDLPVLARALRDRFGRRVRRSPYPSAATAIGLAIAADQMSGYVLTERLTRHFGVWREEESGRRIAFDPIFSKDTPLPAAGAPPLIVRRRYCPVHNIGQFRFLECSSLWADRDPAGDIYIWREVIFPFDPALVDRKDLRSVAIERKPDLAAHEIEEEYRCDSAGVITVTITNLTAGHSQTSRIR